MSAELKPCPFCGGKAVYKLIETYSLDSSYYAVTCTECSGCMEEGPYEKQEDTISSWNTRSTQSTDAQAERVRVLEEALMYARLTFGNVRTDYPTYNGQVAQIDLAVSKIDAALNAKGGVA